jgi:hypothetical protein
MGKLTNLNLPATIADADIPGSITRDTEADGKISAAINAHTATTDPHPLYLNQSEADALYRSQFTTQIFQGGSQQTATYASCWSNKTMATAFWGSNNTSNLFSFGLHVQSYPWADAAYMCFHRPGNVIGMFGVDTDNSLKWGGGNIGSLSRVWHEGYGIPVWQTPSDRRLKKSIRPIPSALEFIVESKPISFQYNSLLRKEYFGNRFQREKVHYGFLADNDFPLQDLVTERDGHLGLDYIEIIPFLCRAIQEQQAQIQELQVQVSDLKGLVTNLN